MIVVAFNPISADLARMDQARMLPMVNDRPADQVRNPTPPDDEEEGQFLPVGVLRRQYIDYLSTKIDEIEEQKEARRYYHGAQYTAEQIRILRDRHQPVVTWPRVDKKINRVVGIIQRMRSDPKAAPQSPKSEQGAEIATRAIRSVLDANSWKMTDPWCLLQASIEGIGGVQFVLDRTQRGTIEVKIAPVIGDEYFYDKASYKFDFTDSRYEGIAKWMDIEEAIELFPDQEDTLRALTAGDSDMTTTPDREYKWVITASHRVRLVEHWYKHKGRWCWAFYIANTILDQGVSPFYDEHGKSTSAFRMFSAAVDQDGDRYGFVRNMKGIQDTLNQGKSKQLHIANSRRLIMEKGAVDDVETARREWARSDGVVEINMGMSDKVKPDNTTADLAAFAAFTEDAKKEFDNDALNVAAVTGLNVTQLSGRAIELLRQPAMAELGFFIIAYRDWKLRVYRLGWNTVQRYWTAERWIRTTDEEGLAQFIQINGLGLDQFNRPVIVNAVGELDVEIGMEEGPDVASLMQEAYEFLKGYPPGTFPPQMMVEMLPVPRSEKKRFLQMLSPPPPPPNPMAEVAQRLALEGMAADVAQKGAKVRDTHAAAEQKLATADEKRAKVGGMAASADLEAAEFARDTLMQARQATQPQPTNPTPL